MKKVWYFTFLLFGACQDKNVMKYEKIFQANLGTNIHEIGSNIPILKSYTNRRGLTDELLADFPALFVEDHKLYVTDPYNKKVNVFSLGKDNKLFFSIPNKGERYEFARPYQSFVDRYGNIYVLAAQTDYESQEILNFEGVESNTPVSTKKPELLQQERNYYIYKFSPKGEFLLRFGYNGINSEPMPMPIRLSGDTFGNVYVYFYEMVSNSMAFPLVRRYSRNGDFNFEFNTRSVKIDTNANDIYYRGSIVSMHNLIEDDQLIVLSEYQPLTNSKGEEVPAFIENIWSSLNVYSILENNFTTQLMTFSRITPEILGTDLKQRIFLQVYDVKKDMIKFIVIDSTTPEPVELFAPIYSSYYILGNYFIDSQGNLYSPIIDRNQNFILLQWKVK